MPPVSSPPGPERRAEGPCVAGPSGTHAGVVRRRHSFHALITRGGTMKVTRTRGWISGSIVAASALLLAACGGGGDTPSSGGGGDQAAAAPQAMVSVTLSDFKIEPATIAVPAGAELMFHVENSGESEHSFAVVVGSQTLESPMIAAGGAGELTVPA